jgi:two-component system OmpR family sensor kinase/two-component system sensor histidine kinase QseC
MNVVGSLRLRVFAFLLALAVVAALGVGGATYAGVRAETDTLFDYHLQQMALSLRDQGDIPEQERVALRDPDLHYVVQVWSLDGTEIYSSEPAPLLPPRAVVGFSTTQAGGQAWRVFSAVTPRSVVQVGQPVSVRRSLAAAAAWRSVLPIAIAAPLVALAMWWLVGASLAPLSRVVQAVRERQPDALMPLSAQGLPSELRPLVESFNHLLSRLEEAFGAQRAFVADAAHELRSPLTALKLQIGLLRDASDEGERHDAQQRLRAGVERAVHLVEQLLALARAEPGAGSAMLPVDLAAIAREAVADAASLAGARRAEVALDAPAALPVVGDPQALRSLLRNLLDNALLYAGPAPRVRLSLKAQEGEAVACVDDTGPGIPPAERERMFDRFHRRDPGQGSGSGLGLAIARAIARQHGGTVTLLDSPEGGLRAQVRLPLGAAQAS